MTELNDREGLLETVRALRADVESAVAKMIEAQEPPRDDDWTLKDVIAHLTSWRLTTAARLEAGLHGGEPELPWPAPLDEDEDLDEINRWFDETNRANSADDIARESHQTFERVERAIATLSDEALFTVGRFAWLPDEALGPAVIGGSLEHHQEHEPDLRARLNSA